MIKYLHLSGSSRHTTVNAFSRGDVFRLFSILLCGCVFDKCGKIQGFEVLIIGTLFAVVHATSSVRPYYEGGRECRLMLFYMYIVHNASVSLPIKINVCSDSCVDTVEECGSCSSFTWYVYCVSHSHSHWNYNAVSRVTVLAAGLILRYKDNLTVHVELRSKGLVNPYMSSEASLAVSRQTVWFASGYLVWWLDNNLLYLFYFYSARRLSIINILL